MLSLKRMKLGTKLFLLVGISLSGLVMLGVVSYLTLERVKVDGPIGNEITRDLKLAGDIMPPPLNILQTRIVVYQILRETDRAKLQAEIADIHRLKQAYLEAHDQWAKELPEGKVRDLVLAKAHDPALAYYQMVEQDLIPAALRGDKRAAESYVPRLVAIYGKHDDAIEAGNKLNAEEVAAAEQRGLAAVRSSTLTLLGLGSVLGLLVCALGVMMVRGILGPVSKTMHVLQALADGDLRETMEVESSDEIGMMGEALNKAIGSVSNTIQSIASTAEHVASASEEISSSASEQAQSAETQKDQTTQVATAMQEMSSTVMQVSDNSNRAAEAARNAAETAKHGGTIVEDTLAKMRVIADSVGQTAKKMEELGKSSDQIGRIIGVIDDIADQTNLLALNAAIEAARAGEQGRGFAVVADEVRKLAERTTTATKEIAQMIKNIQDETKTAVTAMEHGTKQVEEGVASTAQAGDSLREIIQMSEQVGEMITHIATAATEQSSATEQVNNNMDAISKLVKESAIGAQQSAKACQDLSGLALDLQKMVSNFKLGDEQAMRNGNTASRHSAYARLTNGSGEPERMKAHSAAAGR